MNPRDELERQVAELTRQVNEMRARVACLEDPVRPVSTEPRSRRDLLRLGGVAALGALGAAAAAATPVEATSGGNFILGTPNNAENQTSLIADSGNPVPVLLVQSQGFNSTTLSNANNMGGNPFSGSFTALGVNGLSGQPVEGVDGWASGDAAFAVWGFTDSGTGVTGESGTGVSLYARRSGRIRQDPRSAGLPNYSPTAPEQVRDANNVLWINNASGGTGGQVWRRVNTLRFDAADGSGNPYKPFRLLDTRGGAQPAAGSTTVVTAANRGSGTQYIPADAIGVVGNLTAVAYPGGGSLGIMPAGVAYNPASDPSSVNFQVGQYAIANSFICGLNSGQLQVVVASNPSHFIIDITGYIQ